MPLLVILVLDVDVVIDFCVDEVVGLVEVELVVERVLVVDDLAMLVELVGSLDVEV